MDATLARKPVAGIRLSGMNIGNLEALVFAICVFFLSPPFYVWNSVPPLVFILVCVALSARHIARSRRQAVMLLWLFLFYVFMALRSDASVFGFLALLGICTLLMTEDAFVAEVFDKYILVFSITLVPSLLVFLMINVGGIPLPGRIIEPLAALKDYNYTRYPFLVQDNDPLSLVFPRFSGYYDEPGVIGTVSGLILLGTGFNLKKWRYLPIFLAGCLSFSFTFYLIVLVHILLFARLRYKLVALFVVAGLVSLLGENEIISGYLLSRFFNDSGQIARDNRGVQGFNEWYVQYKNSIDYFFGLGLKVSQEVNLGGSSYKDLIVSYGLLGYLMFIGLCLTNALSRLGLNKGMLIYMLFLFIILYQRPFISNYFYMFIILASVPFLSRTSRAARPSPGPKAA